jgi:hypothetical protein
MPEIDFDIREYPGDTELRLQAVRTEFPREAAEIVGEAARRGAEKAREIAPRSNLFRNEGHRISDSILYELPKYLPGGFGGGGDYEARFFASDEIAPHLEYVLEGTPKGDPGEGKIFPKARGNLKGTKGNLGVLALQKEGEKVSFVRWVRGQHPQSGWWEVATGVAERYIEERINDILHGS